MELTDQQKEVVESDGDLAVNAVAGSGKTSTLVKYALARPDKRILNLAFNKSVRNEADQKFYSNNITNTKNATAHSLALRFLREKVNIRQNSYTAFDTKRILKFQKSDIITDMKLGKHVVNMVSCFCNSRFRKVSEMDYRSYLHSKKEVAFVDKYHDELLLLSRQFLGKMKNGEIEVTHDFYLKLFQLQSPKLDFDVIFFDEGQDASPVMLDVFMNQRATKVIVGDEHQQIYRWRYAVNALSTIDFPKKYLTKSFRFPQAMADLAVEVLNTKHHLYEPDKMPNIPDILGKGVAGTITSRAVLGRSNSAVLVEAIRLLIEEQEISKLYFEGNFHTYTYADEGGSIYDVLNLYYENRHKIRDPLIKSFKDFQELEAYADETEDAPMKGIIGIVKEYKKELPSLIKTIKDHHVDDGQKNEAEVVFSTVHKAKGMEYDEVTLLNDFLSEERMISQISQTDEPNWSRLEEDVNILYVAATRAKCKLNICKETLPLCFRDEHAVGDEIEVYSSDEEEGEEEELMFSSNTNKHDKSYSVDKIRKEHQQAYEKWTQKRDEELLKLVNEGLTTAQLATHFGRTKGAIRSRIKKLSLD
ncbi:MAG: UvrD-helicase domain-containing protein [Bacteroidota bacterium]